MYQEGQYVCLVETGCVVNGINRQYQEKFELNEADLTNEALQQLIDQNSIQFVVVKTEAETIDSEPVELLEAETLEFPRT